jgi:hypothetical protein
MRPGHQQQARYSMAHGVNVADLGAQHCAGLRARRQESDPSDRSNRPSKTSILSEKRRLGQENDNFFLFPVDVQLLM